MTSTLPTGTVPVVPVPVVPVAEARAGLSSLLREFRDRPDAEPIVIGAHRRPEVVLMPYAQYISRRDAAKTAEDCGSVGAAGPAAAGGRRSVLDDLRRRRTLVARLARANRVGSVQVFGSVARGEETASSDIDLLVTPADDASLFDLAQFELDLEALFERPVDVVSSRSLDPERDRAVLDSAIDL